MALLSNGLLPASFRGAPFAVEQEGTGGGRRVALHTYPGRDEPWAEDMGRAPRSFRFRGFIVDGDVVFAGGPIQLQRALLLAALEQSGPGTLTHPTLGILNVSVRSFELGSDLGAGRMSRVDIEFVESGKRSFPSLLSTSSGLLSAAKLAKVALAVDLVRAATLASGQLGAADNATAVSVMLRGQVETAAGDATAITRLVAVLPGNFGRYSSGGNTGFVGSNAYAGGSDLSTLIDAGAAQRAMISTTADAVGTAISQVGATTTYNDVGAAVSALLDALLACCADPADAIRLLSDLLGYSTSAAPAQSLMGFAMLLAFRRAAAIALATAASAYQPRSYDDAFSLLATIGQILSDTATAAADEGDDASFNAIRTLRSQVIQDLRARGAQLARVRTVAMKASAPAIVLGQRLYRDAARAEELVTEAQPRNPLFMPTTFTALAA